MSIKKELLLHVLIWLVVIQLLFDIPGLYEAVFRDMGFGSGFVDEAFIIIPAMMGLFYWNLLVLIPRFYAKQKKWKYLLLLLLSFILTIGLVVLTLELFTQLGFYFHADRTEIVEYSSEFNVLIISVSSIIGISRVASENVGQKQKAVERQKEAELSMLKAQVSPHFLFNTLNTIYSIAIDEDAIQSSNAVLKLSGMMRYILEVSEEQAVSLEKEIQFLEDFVELNLLRLPDSVEIDFGVVGNIKDYFIAPVLLIPFVENVFKHGVSYQKKAPLSIQIEIVRGTLSLSTQNIVKDKESLEIVSGKGIANAKDRLNFSYPDRHSLEITQAGELYKVELSIQLL